MKAKGKNKILLLGWDAADWKVINPLVDKGWMPNMKRLVEQGTISNLTTLDPMYSPMLWTSIATGKRPYKHGVLGFTEPTPDGTKIRPVMSVSRNCKAIWNIFTQKELKSHVVGWWPSHPAEQINGVMISNFYQNPVGKINEPWPIPKGAIHPEGQAEFLAQFRVHPQELTSNHILPFVPEAGKVNQQKDKKLKAISTVTAHAASLHAVFTNIIRNQEWDFAALYLDAIDHYCHGFMKYHPPKRSHIPQEDYDLYHNVVTAGYRFHDMILGRIMDLIDENTTLMLVSDHGFQPDHLRPRNIPKVMAGPAFEHNPLGIMAVMGPGIKKDHITFGTSILDITPTLLHIAGFPVGEDMDGKVMNAIFENPKEIAQIPSWEQVAGYTGMIEDDNPVVKENTGAEAIKQLEDLGYIEKQAGSTVDQLQKVSRECQFNLARSYIDGGKIKKAIEVLEPLVKGEDIPALYNIKLAACYQMAGQLKEARKVIEAINEEEHFAAPVIDVMLGNLFLAERQPIKAIKLFKSAQQRSSFKNSKINFQLARAYVLLQRLEEAKELILKELAYNEDNDLAWYELGSIQLMQKDFKEAVDSFLKALGINFNNPMYHYQLGVSLFKEGQYPEAAKAFENTISIFPKNNKAREYLIDIYSKKWINESRLAVLKEEHKNLIEGTIYIVSGLPRTGTSMMMQMLEKGGLPIFTDKKRASDESNPKGYYEHDAVKTLARNKKWLPQAKDKVVKVIVQLLPHLPANFRYKVIFMERDIHEVLASQRNMLKRLGKESISKEDYPLQLMESFQKGIATGKEWATRSPNVELLSIQYKDVLEQPFEQALRINDFLAYKLLPELMVQAVDVKLYREKLD